MAPRLALSPAFSPAFKSSIQAGVIFSNFGPSDSYNSGGFRVDLGEALAAPFTNVADALLGSIEVPVANYSPGSLYFVQMASDAAGLPGGVLESFANVTFPSTPGIVTVTSADHPSLAAGGVYWVIVGLQGSDNVQGGQWFVTDPRYGGAFAWSPYPYESWNPTRTDFPAFRVNSLDSGAVPEPGTIGLTMLGGLALLAIRRKRSA